MRVKITSYERKKRDVGQDASDTIDQRLYLKSTANNVIGRTAMLKLKCERYSRYRYSISVRTFELMAPDVRLQTITSIYLRLTVTFIFLAPMVCHRDDYENCYVPANRR